MTLHAKGERRSEFLKEREIFTDSMAPRQDPHGIKYPKQVWPESCFAPPLHCLVGFSSGTWHAATTTRIQC